MGAGANTGACDLDEIRDERRELREHGNHRHTRHGPHHFRGAVGARHEDLAVELVVAARHLCLDRGDPVSALQQRRQAGELLERAARDRHHDRRAHPSEPGKLVGDECFDTGVLEPCGPDDPRRGFGDARRRVTLAGTERDRSRDDAAHLAKIDEPGYLDVARAWAAAMAADPTIARTIEAGLAAKR